MRSCKHHENEPATHVGTHIVKQSPSLIIENIYIPLCNKCDEWYNSIVNSTVKYSSFKIKENGYVHSPSGHAVKRG